MDEKLICGIKHYKRPCQICKELIWTNQKSTKTVICDTCMPIGVKQRVGNPHPTTPKSQSQYNG